MNDFTVNELNHERCFDAHTGNELLYINIPEEILSDALDIPTQEFGVGFNSGKIKDFLDNPAFVPTACVFVDECQNVTVEDIRFLLSTNQFEVAAVCDMKSFDNENVLQTVYKGVCQAVQTFLEEHPAQTPVMQFPNGKTYELKQGQKYAVDAKLKNGEGMEVEFHALPDGNVHVEGTHFDLNEEGQMDTTDFSEIMSPERAGKILKTEVSRYDKITYHLESKEQKGQEMGE